MRMCHSACIEDEAKAGDASELVMAGTGILF